MRWLDGITDSMDGSLTQEDSEGQGSLAHCNSWGRKEADTTESLNSNSETHSTQLPVIVTNFQRLFYCKIIYYELIDKDHSVRNVKKNL